MIHARLSAPEIELAFQPGEERLKGGLGCREKLRKPAEIAAAFLADAPATFAQLSAAIASGDAEAARKFAHTLKGSSANMGGEKFSEIASRMESAGKQRDPGRLSELLPAAEAAFQSLIAGLKSEFDLRG